MSEPIVSHVHDIAQQLTDREREVLALIAEGLTVPEIARRLHRSRKTIESHRLSLGRKLGVENRVKLARLAIQAGLAPLEVSEQEEEAPTPPGEAIAPTGVEPRVVEVLEASRDGLNILDRQGYIVLANAALCDILARPRDEVIGRSPVEFVHVQQRDWYRRMLEDRRNRQNSALRLDLYRGDGQLVRVQATSESLFDRDNNYIGSMGRVREIERWQPA